MGWEQKYEALDFFVRRLLTDGVERSVAKIILFGSLAGGEVEPESDIDLFIVALDDLPAVSQRCAEASLETALRYGEQVEPIVGCIDKYLLEDSYFSYHVLRDGKEIYSMDEREIQRGQARTFLLLAIEYLDQSRANLALGNYRLLVDGAYNAAELCVKGLLVLKGETIPRRHGRIIGRFSELYIKGGEIPRELGRRLNRGLELRNRARYEYHTEVTERDAEEMLTLADALVTVLENRLMEEGSS